MRELRQHASRWLSRVAAGESFEITDRGRPIATLSPVAMSTWDHLVASGAVSPATGNLRSVEPAAADATRPSVSELLRQDREDSR